MKGNTKGWVFFAEKEINRKNYNSVNMQNVFKYRIKFLNYLL